MHRVLFDREYPGPSGSGSRAQHRELMRPVATMPCRVKALSCRTREDVDWIDIVHSAQKLNPWKQATLVVTGVDICVYAGAPSADRAPFWLRQSVDVEPEAETIAFTTLALVVAVTHDSTVPMEVGIKFCGEEIYRHLGPSDEVRQLLGGSGAGAGSGAGVGSAPSRSFRQAFDHALSRMAITELRLRFGSAEEAEAACSCVCNAVDTFTSAGPWLSAGLPLHFAPQVALAAATDTRGPGAAAAPDVVLAVCPEWDAPLQLPDGWAAAAEAAELPGHLLLLLHTPTGPHLCSLPRSDAAQLLTGGNQSVGLHLVAMPCSREAGSSEDWGGLSDECGSSAPTPRTPQLRLPSASGRDDSRPATSSSSAGRPRVWQRRVPPLPVYYVVQCSLAAAACSHEGGSECSSSGSAGGHEVTASSRAEAAAAGQAPGLVEGCCLGVLLFWALQCLVQLIQHCQLSWAAISTALATLAAAHLLLHRAAPPPLLQRRLAAWRRRLSHRRAAAPAAPAPEAAPASCQLTLHGCEACREPPPSRVMLASEWRLGGSSWHGSSLEEEVGGELYAHARPATATTTAAALTAGRHLPGSCAPSVSAPLPSSPASSHDAAADGRGRDAAPPLPQGSPDGERADAGEEPAWMTADVKQRFVNGCRGNLKLARRRLQCTADWRAANAIDSILQRPQPCFGLLKRHFPHGVHCMTADGNTPVLIMKFGEMKNAYDQMVADGITAEKGMLHMAFVYEWVFNVLSPGHLPLGNLVNVFDLAGMGFGDLRSDAMKFAFSCADVAGTHYPERLLKAFIVNVPFWFSVLWGMTSPLLEERTRKRTLVLWKKEAVREEMLKLVAEEELPVEYGGLCTRPLADSPRERELYAMVQQLNSTEAS